MGKGANLRDCKYLFHWILKAYLLDLALNLELDLDNKSVTTRPEPGVTFLRRSVYRV